MQTVEGIAEETEAAERAFHETVGSLGRQLFLNHTALEDERIRCATLERLLEREKTLLACESSAHQRAVSLNASEAEINRQEWSRRRTVLDGNSSKLVEGATELAAVELNCLSRTEETERLWSQIDKTLSYSAELVSDLVKERETVGALRWQLQSQSPYPQVPRRAPRLSGPGYCLFVDGLCSPPTSTRDDSFAKLFQSFEGFGLRCQRLGRFCSADALNRTLFEAFGSEDSSFLIQSQLLEAVARLVDGDRLTGEASDQVCRGIVIRAHVEGKNEGMRLRIFDSSDTSFTMPLSTLAQLIHQEGTFLCIDCVSSDEGIFLLAAQGRLHICGGYAQSSMGLLLEGLSGIADLAVDWPQFLREVSRPQLKKYLFAASSQTNLVFRRALKGYPETGDESTEVAPLSDGVPINTMNSQEKLELVVSQTIPMDLERDDVAWFDQSQFVALTTDRLLRLLHRQSNLLRLAPQLEIAGLTIEGVTLKSIEVLINAPPSFAVILQHAFERSLYQVCPSVSVSEACNSTTVVAGKLEPSPLGEQQSVRYTLSVPLQIDPASLTDILRRTTEKISSSEGPGRCSVEAVSQIYWVRLAVFSRRHCASGYDAQGLIRRALWTENGVLQADATQRFGSALVDLLPQVDHRSVPNLSMLSLSGLHHRFTSSKGIVLLLLPQHCDEETRVFLTKGALRSAAQQCHRSGISFVWFWGRILRPLTAFPARKLANVPGLPRAIVEELLLCHFSSAARLCWWPKTRSAQFPQSIVGKETEPAVTKTVVLPLPLKNLLVELSELVLNVL
jgi:hypothetical protein